MLYANSMLTNSIYVIYNKIIQTAPWQILFIHLPSNDTNSTLSNTLTSWLKSFNVAFNASTDTSPIDAYQMEEGCCLEIMVTSPTSL